jgi:HD-GYP domain-containing protein (c-di-GMP phosphodiesterase class II)
VRESVLNKPGRLTDEEFQHVKYHCEMGEHILAPIVEDEEILRVVRHHHERYDGTGYPNRLSGEQIPLGARILAVADTYDAMTSERPYRKAMSAEAACAEIERGKGTQFDPEVADAFLKSRQFANKVV